ncbi:transcriptional regulator [Saccharibacter sp. 17.LH.SD]|nr:transcriptional regulator [Saccharibacter sp. 17.LH.SD]
MAQKRTGMHPEDIRAILRKRYGSMAALGRLWGVSRTAIPNTINQPGYSVPMEGRLAHELGSPAHEIWPDRYHRDGTPVSFRTDRAIAARQSVNLRKSGGAT